jgi:two-component system CheB/CheR fusion protein
MVNLLKSTDIGTVFLDASLNLRKFTPAAQADINLLEQDIGRPLGHITHNLVGANLELVARQDLDELAAFEQQVRSKAGKWYQLRAMPYRTHANQIEGVVLTLVDITALKKAERLVGDLSEASGNGAGGIKTITEHQDISDCNQLSIEQHAPQEQAERNGHNSGSGSKHQ